MTEAPSAARARGRRRSLRWELVVTLAVLLMMTVVSLSLATEALGRRRHGSQQREQLANHVRSLAILLGPQLRDGALAAEGRGHLEPLLRASIGTLGVEAVALYRVGDTSERPVLGAGLLPPLPPPPPLNTSTLERTATPQGFIVVDRALRSFGTTRTDDEFIVRAVARPNPWSRTQDGRGVLVLALGVGVVMLVLGIGLIELQVIRPLAQVRAAVGEVAQGNLRASIPEEGPQELRSLAGSFNTMTRALRERAEQIEQQRERLVRSEQLASVGRIAAGIAHEVGNPLAAVLGYVELLLDPRNKPALDDSQRDMLARSRTQIERIQAIVTQLLDYSAPPRQQPQQLRAVGVAKGLCALLKHDPRCAGVAFEVRGDARTTLFADPGLVDQVLRNLLVNGARAAAHGEDPPAVAVFVERHGDHTCLDVQDSGPGVPKEAEARLFEPFFTTARAGEGTGLGLPICQGLVASMHGTLEHRPPGSRPPLRAGPFPGAIFRVTLPSRHPSAAAS